MVEIVNMQTIEERALLPGDVLLSLGDGALSEGIMSLDGGSYSHAALWSGHETIEATLPNVRRQSLSQSRSHARYIDVFRHADPHRPRDEIVSRAVTYIGTPYAETDLMIATLVLTVSAWMPEKWSEVYVLFGLGTLRRWLDTLRGMNRERSNRFTCVALAVQAHAAARFPVHVRLNDDRQVDIRVMVRAFRALVELRSSRRARDAGDGNAVASPSSRRNAERLDREEAELLEELERCVQSEAALVSALSAGGRTTEPGAGRPSALLALRQEWRREFGVPVSDILAAMPAGLADRELLAGSDWPISLVTPRQVQTSPSMAPVGRIWLRASG
jgi:hypothetical protein